MRNPTLRKLRNRNLIPIRYRMPDPYNEARHGWIIEELPRGGLIIQLVGEDRKRRLSLDETKYVKRILGG